MDNEVEIVDDDVTVLGGGTEEFTITEIETDVINGGDQESEP